MWLSYYHTVTDDWSSPPRISVVVKKPKKDTSAFFSLSFSFNEHTLSLFWMTQQMPTCYRQCFLQETEKEEVKEVVKEVENNKIQ